MQRQQSFPHPIINNEFIEAKWNGDFESLELVYHDKILKHFSRTELHKDGIYFEHDMLGEVHVYLSKSNELQLKIAGIHSLANSEHPKNTIKSIGRWVLASLIIHGIVTLVLAFNFVPTEIEFPLPLYALFLLATLGILAVTIAIRKKKYNAYYIGLAIHYFEFLVLVVVLTDVETFDPSALYSIAPFIIFILALTAIARRVLEYNKHVLYLNDDSEDVFEL